MQTDIRQQIKGAAHHIRSVRSIGCVAASHLDHPTGRVIESLGGLPDGLGRDLVELLWIHGKTRVTGLYDAHGVSPSSESLEARCYRRIAEHVQHLGEQCGVRTRQSRLWWRMASAMLIELLARRTCGECDGVGHRGVDELGLEDTCPACSGAGLRRSSRTWRATQCECNRADFGDRLDGLYQDAFCALVDIERESIRAIERAVLS